MKKKFLAVMGAAMLALTIGACTPKANTPTGGDDPIVITTKYTVVFEVDGARYKTMKVEEGKTITETVVNPEKEGMRFAGWMENGVIVDLSTYVVTHDVTFTAKFEEAGNVLNVDDVKDATKTYSVVLGWWESTNTTSTSFPYSGMTKGTVRLFYANLIKYLKKTGFTDAQINAISFRNYSSYDVASMGELVVADGDVELMIGVGKNVFSGTTIPPYNTSDDSKFETVMGANNKSRYVAILKDARDPAKAIYDWLNNSDVAKQAFVKEMTDEEIEQSMQAEVINLTVRVHGDTVETTTLTDKDTKVSMPTITVPDRKVFKGFSLTENGEVDLAVAKNASLKYGDLKELANGATSIDLYPVYEDAPTVEEDLVVAIQTHNTRLPEREAKLLEERFNATLTTENVKVVTYSEDANTFKASVLADSTIDVVIGGKDPLQSFESPEGYGFTIAGAKHFVNTTRYVAVLSSGASEHLELAKALFDFVKAEAPVYSVYTSIWGNAGKNVTAEEVKATKTGFQTAVNTYFNVEDAKEKLNIELNYYETEATKVAQMGEETKALNGGAGADLIVGCGSNVDDPTKGNMTIVEKKTTTKYAAADRYVALVKEGVVARSIYETYFVDTPTE